MWSSATLSSRRGPAFMSPAPTCSPGWAATTRRPGRTAPRWNWSRPRPNAATSSAAWPDKRFGATATMWHRYGPNRYDVASWRLVLGRRAAVSVTCDTELYSGRVAGDDVTIEVNGR